MKTDEHEKAVEEIKKIDNSIPEKIGPISYADLEAVMSKWLLIRDIGLLRIVLAAVIANKLNADPVWIFIVAAPGATKTEFIRGLNKIDGIYPISDLTPNTFLSGQKGENGSLLLRLPNGTIFTYKDFTTVLSMHRDKQQAIIAQLREIFDGYYRKEFGTGETKTWEGKIGFIAGVTSVIDKHYEIYSVLGERFIQYRPVQPNPIEVAKKAMRNSGVDKQMRDEIQNAMASFVAGIELPEGRVEISLELEDKIAHLAAFCVRARSGIIRDGYSTREIDFIPETELPTRLAKQLITLYTGLTFVGHVSIEADYELIKKVALDSLPKKRKLVLGILIENKDEHLNTKKIGLKINYPTNTTRRALEDLHALGLISKEGKGQGSPDEWWVSKSTLYLLEKAGLDSLVLEKKGKEGEETSLPETSEESVEEDMDEVFDKF